MSTLTTFPDVTQGSDEWLEQRRGMVTASIVGQLISVHSPGPVEYNCPDCAAPAGQPCISKRGGTPMKTTHPARVTVAAENSGTAPPILETATGDTATNRTLLLTAERISGWVDPAYVSDDMLRGIEDEPRARDAYSEHYAPVAEVGFMVRDFGGYRIGYSPDGLVGEDGLIEIKSRRAKKQLQTVLEDAVPAENMAQVQCGLLVSGRCWCDYVSYCGGLPLWPKRVFPDEQWFAAIHAAVQVFEEASAQMTSTYLAAVDGLPTTERVTELEMIL